MTEQKLRVLIRERRQALGLSQQQLATQVGVSRQTLVALEARRLVPSVVTALKLARALHCAVEELFQLPSPEISATLAEEPRLEPPFRVRVARVGERLLAWPALSEEIEAEGIAKERSGTWVRVETLIDPEDLVQGLVLVGCDPALALLGTYVKRRHRNLRVIWLPRGSLTALRLLARGQAHVAGTHLWDPESNEFNLPVIQRELAGRAVLVVTFSRWVEGLALAPGNPKRIRKLADLAHPEVTIVNREPGAGSRIVFEHLLRQEDVPLSALRGIERELPSHRSVAEAIAAGLADAGPLVWPSARTYGLDFLPLLEERYDLVIPLELVDQPPIRDLLDLLTSRQFRRELEASGYDVRQTGVVVGRLT